MLALAATAGATSAASLAINFDGRGDVLAAGDPFGIADSDWNNLGGASGTSVAVTADDSSAATVTWANGGEWSSGASTTGDESVLKGYLDDWDTQDGSNTPQVTLSGLNTFAPSGYTVTAYYTTDGVSASFDAGSIGGAGADTVSDITVSAGTSQSQTWNFVSGDSFTLVIGDDTRSNGRATFSGITVTTIPEPSSAALIGLGGLALILRRRK